MKHLKLLLITLLLIPFTVFSQGLSEQDLQKIIRLNNEREHYKKQYSLCEGLYNECLYRHTLKDSVIQSKMIQLKKQTEVIANKDLIIGELTVAYEKQQRGIQVRNFWLKVGIPAAFILGVATPIYISTQLP